jgi:hypothetical protein
VDTDERQRLPRVQHQERRTDEGDQVDGKEGRLQPPSADGSTAQRLDAGHVQVQAFQQHDREEEERLVAGRPAEQSAAAGPLLGEVDQRPGRCDVRVEFGVVGLRVVPVVLPSHHPELRPTARLPCTRPSR